MKTHEPTVDLSKLPLKYQIKGILIVEKESLTLHNIHIKASIAAFEAVNLYPRIYQKRNKLL